MLIRLWAPQLHKWSALAFRHTASGPPAVDWLALTLDLMMVIDVVQNRRRRLDGRHRAFQPT
jgi:hypothetical protein